MRIGVTISRDWDDYETVIDALLNVTLRVNCRDVTLIHGASQMDWFIAGAACFMDMKLEPHPADWKTHGKAAGPIRNAEMVALGADVWLAFIKNESPGATQCAMEAESAGIPVRRYRI